MKQFNKDIIFKAYIETTLWTAELERFSESDIHKDNLSSQFKDVIKFVNDNQDLLEKSGLDEGAIGHNFLLTRNHHGAGFWDRNLGDIGKQLTEASQKFNEFLIIYDEGDKLIYIE